MNKKLKQKTNYTKLVKVSGLKLQHDKTKYANIKTLKDASAKILEIKKALGITENRAPTRSELEDNGYSGFLNVFRNTHFTYNDAVRKAGLSLNYDPKKWAWLDKGDTLQVAGNYFKEIYNNELKNILNLKDKKAPRIDDLIKFGPKGFYFAVIDRGIKYNELVKAAGLIPNTEPFKWGKNFNVEKAKEYLLDLIDSGALDGLELSDGEAPTVIKLRDDGHNDFVQKFLKMGIKYNDILRLANLKINHQPYKYINYTIQDFVEFFKKIMNSNEIKSLNLDLNEAPTIEQLSELGFGFFPIAINKRSISYNEIISIAGYAINHHYRKYINYTDKDFIEEIKNILLNPLIREKLNLVEKEAPTVKQLIYLGYRDIIHQVIDRKISYNYIVKSSGLVPNTFQTRQEIGRMFHWIIEYFFIDFMSSLGFISFFEIRPNIMNNRSQCDISVVRDFNSLFPKFFEEKIAKYIYMVNIDLTMTSDDAFIREKCFRGYQGKNKSLIIVPLYASNSVIKSLRNKALKDIPHVKNVKILSSKEFLDLFAFPKNYRKLFDEFLDLARKSMYDEEDYKEFELKSLKYQKMLIEKFSNRRQKGLEKHLRTIGKISLLKDQ